MDKSDVKVHESQSDTSSVITMKEYAPSEYPSSEPPPAYIKPHSNALRIAKLAAFTVIVSSIILGGFILAASWIQANTAKNLDLTLNQELLDDLHPSYDHLVANEVLPEQQRNFVDSAQTKNEAGDESLVSSNTDKVVDKSKSNNDEGLLPPPPPPSPKEKPEEKKTLNLDEIANILMQKNLKGNVNCIVEKRRNEELVDHAPMSLNLPSGNMPFGLNISTPPRLQHLTGEQMIVICKGDDDEEKDSESDEQSDEEENKIDQMQSIVFPLPHQLLNQIQHLPQIIPLNNILQHIPLQQLQMQQAPVQQFPVQQLQVQQIPVQQIQMHHIPLQHIQPQQIPIQRINVPHMQLQQQAPPPQQQIVYQQPMIIEQPQPQIQQQPQQQVFVPHKIIVPQPQMPQQNVPFSPEIIPLKEVRINENKIPVNHVLHHRVPINPMAINEVPISRMPITHLPIRAEPQIKEEPVPVHHLIPPQVQHHQPENFKQEEPRFNNPVVQEPINHFPILPPLVNQHRPMPVEVRDPGAIKMPGPLHQEHREHYPSPQPGNQFFPPNLVENREPEFPEENKGFRQLMVDVRPRGQRKEPMANILMPNMPKIIPLNFERPIDNGRRIRFPEMVDSDEVREHRVPIITEITKIIPIRLEKEDSEVNESPIIALNKNSQPKNIENPEIKVEKILPRPFPIPINAILDMIFRGIRPLMNNRGHSLPIPIDIKIERIENKPFGLMPPPFIKKFEIIKKESPNSINEENQTVPQVEKSESENENENEKEDAIETKVERVEVFDRDNENAHPIPIPADAQDPQVFKLEEQEKQEEGSESTTFEEQAFLPNGQGRGARVFPIPQPIKEAEIFSVFDAKSEKNVEADVPMESSITVVNSENERTPEAPESRQGRVMDFPGPIFNFFPIPENKIAKPDMRIISNIQPQTFTVPESRSLKLYPVPNAGFKAEELKPPMANANVEENRPHFVQPRSV